MSAPLIEKRKVTAPESKKIRAIDVRPFEWALWCSIEKGEPFANTIESRKWSDDGQHIWFMLGTHNFYKAAPDDELELIPETPPTYAPLDDQAAFIAKRPVPTSPCAACGGRGRVAKGAP